MNASKLGLVGNGTLTLGLVASLLTVIGYVVSQRRPDSRPALLFARLGYALSATGALATFGILAFLMYNRHYEFNYVWEHSGNAMQKASVPFLPFAFDWYRLAATWAGQEGSFLLWAAWTAIIGFLVFAKAGKYEARVMPFYVTILGFLCAILLKQSPFHLIPAPTLADLAANPTWHYPPLDGQGLTPSLQNYWMTIHPPTIFFGFASLAVPFCYAIAALLWRDYDGWTRRVMPYALLSVATLGGGLFMGGYWAYETQGWHGFWAWDPVENASFFPWLAVTALAHGLVAQKSRGSLARANIFLAIFAFWLFLLGTFLTRSGALSGKDASGQMLSVHAFDNISKSGLYLMVAMLVLYGTGGLILWLLRLKEIPARKTTGETLVSRDFAFVLSVLLMVIACVVVAMGTTTPLALSWMHRAPFQPNNTFYNRLMLPLSIVTALIMGCAPWLAWRKTDPDKFMKKLMIPWFAMIAFGFFLVVWALGAERATQASVDPSGVEYLETMRAWVSPTVQRLAVVSLAALGFFAAFSNAMLAYRVFRAKPLSAGGWLAHVGIGVFMLGVIVSNTYERTERFNLLQGGPAHNVFGYQIAFEKMTGKTMTEGPLARPVNPDYDKDNAVQLRVTPPEGETTGLSDGAKTFVVSPRWFVWNLNAASEDKFERMRWPHIQKFVGHDLYVGFANDPAFQWPTDDPKRERPGLILQPKEKRQIGPYTIGYYESFGEPGRVMGAHIILATQDGKIVEAMPAIKMDDGGFTPVNTAVPELKDENGNPGVIILDKMDAATKAVNLRVSLPGYAGVWAVPLEVTFKPWVNLVWAGVIIAVAGTLLAMLRRILEARQSDNDTPNDRGGSGPKQPKREPLDIREEAIFNGMGGTMTPIVASALQAEPESKEASEAKPTPARKGRKLKTQPS